MEEHGKLKINLILDDCFGKIKALKSLNARFQRYEYCAILRGVEKRLEEVSDQLDVQDYAALTLGLTPKGRLFYNELFRYGIYNNWKPLPENVRNLLIERKAELNALIEFDNDGVAALLKLNQQLTKQEERINDFHNYIEQGINEKGLADFLKSSGADCFTLKCFTRGKAYEFNPGSFDHDRPFYQLRFSINDLNSQPAACDGDDKIDYANYLACLPIRMWEEKCCKLFTYLATNGLLAWADFLNIDHVEIDLKLHIGLSI